MAKNDGWWELKLGGNSHSELCDCDLKHIASKIKEGYTGGEIVKDELEVENE